MNLDPKKFLDALLAFMAAASELTATSPRPLWANEAIQAQATDPYSVLRIYDGNLPYMPVTSLSIQCLTAGSQASAAFEQASKLYQTLLDAQGRPVTMLTVGTGSTYRINGITLKAPGFVGVDEENRSLVPFNFDCTAVEIS